MRGRYHMALALLRAAFNVQFQCRKADKFSIQGRLHFDEEISSPFAVWNRSRLRFSTERNRSGRTNAASEVSAAGERYDDRASRDK